MPFTATPSSRLEVVCFIHWHEELSKNHSYIVFNLGPNDRVLDLQRQIRDIIPGFEVMDMWLWKLHVLIAKDTATKDMSDTLQAVQSGGSIYASYMPPGQKLSTWFKVGNESETIQVFVERKRS